MAALTIGQVASAAACNTASIRYYEDIGLLPKAGRRTGGHRIYGREDVARLVFIRRCRDFGFSIQEIRDLLAVSGGQACAAALDIAKARLEAVRVKLDEMRFLEAGLARFVARCETNCCNGPAADCTLYDDLGHAGVGPQ